VFVSVTLPEVTLEEKSVIVQFWHVSLIASGLPPVRTMSSPMFSGVPN